MSLLRIRNSLGPNSWRPALLRSEQKNAKRNYLLRSRDGKTRVVYRALATQTNPPVAGYGTQNLGEICRKSEYQLHILGCQRWIVALHIPLAVSFRGTLAKLGEADEKRCSSKRSAPGFACRSKKTECGDWRGGRSCRPSSSSRKAQSCDHDETQNDSSVSRCRRECLRVRQLLTSVVRLAGEQGIALKDLKTLTQPRGLPCIEQ